LTTLRILFGAAFVFLVSSAAGKLLFRALRLRLRPYESGFLSFVAGAAVFSNIVFLLAATGIFYTYVLVAVGAAILAASWLTRPVTELPDDACETELSRAWKLVFWLPYVLFSLIYVVAAMAPETSPDGGGGYHLGLVSRYYDHRGFVPIRTNMYAGLSAGIEMLFLAAFAFGRHSAAALTHLLFLLTLPFGMIASCRRAGKPRAGVIGGLLFFIAPVVAKDATCAYVDVATAAVAFGAFCFFEVWREENQKGALVAVGLLSGFCYACKFTTGTAIVFAIVAVAATGMARRVGTRILFGQTALVAAVALALVLPWTVRDAYVFGNPFFPFLNKLFPNPWQYEMVEAEFRRMLAHMSDVQLWQIPFEVTTGGKLIGVIGPVFLLAPLAAFSARSRFGRHLLLAAVAFAVTYFANIGSRFLIPALPFLSLALALGILELPRVGNLLALAVVLMHGLLSWPSFMDSWSPGYQWRVDNMNLSAALRITPEKQFLTDHWGDYQAGVMLDRFVPAGDLVYSPDMGQFAYHHRDMVGNFDSSIGRRAFMTFRLPFEPGLALTWKRNLHTAATRLTKLRLVAGTKADVDLRLSEIRFFKGAKELLRSAEWRLSASANPWEVQKAFDNGRISWWTSGQYVEPGMWLETDFGGPVEIDRIQIEQNADQRWTSIRPAVWGERTASWSDLSFREAGTEEPAPKDVRMEVRDELKQMGIRWILIREGNAAARSLRTDSPNWGMTEIGATTGFQLWRLD
jgi:hypothetical protein